MLHQTLSEYYDRSTTSKGSSTNNIGIEIEVEGKNLRDPDVDLRHWNLHEEGSLRDGGIEFVTKQGANLNGLTKYFDEYDRITAKAKFKESLRTSVHVHVDVRGLTLMQIYTVITAWCLLEDFLVGTNGPTRIGNLFCLRNRDAEGIQDRILQEIKSGGMFRTWTNTHRYAALNLAALQKFGTLEFRFIRGLVQRKPIEMWTRGLSGFVKKASEFQTPLRFLDFYQREVNSPVKGYESVISFFFEEIPSMMTFFRIHSPVGFQTDNHNLGFALILANTLDSFSKKKIRLNLSLREDIDPVTDGVVKSDKIHESPKKKRSIHWNTDDLAPIVTPATITGDTLNALFSNNIVEPE